MVLHFVKLTMPVLWSVSSLYWIIVTCYYSNIIKDLWVFMMKHAHTSNPLGAKEGRSDLVLWSHRGEWCAGIDRGNDVTCAQFFLPFKQKATLFLFEKATQLCPGLRFLPRVLSFFYVLLHRSSIAPVRCARYSRRQATFSMICRVDCHWVGRLGRSASAHTAANDYR